MTVRVLIVSVPRTEDQDAEDGVSRVPAHVNLPVSRSRPAEPQRGTVPSAALDNGPPVAIVPRCPPHFRRENPKTSATGEREDGG